MGRRSWTCALDATNRPLDWRAQATAHGEFVVTDKHQHVGTQAVDLATALRCGYSSQDWIVTADDTYVIDVNPAGQWLFLPEPFASEITEALAVALTYKR